MNPRLKPVVRGNVKGLENTVAAAMRAIHTKPTLMFTMSGQVPVDRDNNALSSDQDERFARYETTQTDIPFQVDPSKITVHHQDHLQACTDRLNAAQRQSEKLLLASGQATGQIDIDKSRRTLSREDLPDTELLLEVYGEQKEAADARLIACVTLDEDGHTNWGYTDDNDQPVQLTMKFLRENVLIADAMQTAFVKYLNPTRASSEATGKTKQENGIGDSTQKTSQAQ